MNLIESMNNVVNYIEDNLENEIDYDIAAKKAMCSKSHLQNMFMAITSVSISEYIRRRRLSSAAFDLKNTNLSVLDIAVKYGYNSADSFTRAFKSIHGITPSESRKDGVVLKAYAPIKFVLSIKGVTAMNYRIEKKDKIRVVGIKKWFSTKNDQQLKEIPKMWDDLSKEDYDKLCRIGDINACIGLCADMYNDGFDYWIGTFSDKPCPEGMYELEIKESDWAIFEVIGAMRPIPNKMQEVWGRIYSEWLPNSGYDHAEIPEIEYYSDGDMNSENYMSQIWIPVVAK